MNKILRANLYLTLCTIIWGGTFVVIKLTLSNISPLFLVSLRFGLAALVLLPFIMAEKNLHNLFIISLKKGVVVKHGLYLGAITITGFGLQTIGLQFTTASRSAFITELLIIFTPFFQYLLYRSMPGVGNLIGMLLILPGLYVITSFGNEFMNTGDTITFFSAIGFSMYIVYLDHYSKIHNEFLLLFWQMISTSFFALLLALFSEKIIIEINLNFILLLLFLSLLGTLIAVYLQTKYQKLTSPVHAGILYAMEPVFAAIFAYFFLGEHPGPYFYPGAVLILAGVILSSVIDARTKRTRDKNVKYDRNAVKNL